MPSFSYKNPNTPFWCFPSSSLPPAVSSSCSGFLCFCEVSQPDLAGTKKPIPQPSDHGTPILCKSQEALECSEGALLLVARKGLISKRRFIMDMNFMVKRGKLFRKSVTNYFMLHHHHSRDTTRGGFGIQDYEFSCSNTPTNPVFSHMSKEHHTYFPCINLPVEMIETKQQENDFTSNQMQYYYNALSPAMEGGSPLVSPFNVRISNYSSEEENEISSESGLVDNQAEEFIRRFYEQLKMQRRLQLLQYS